MVRQEAPALPDEESASLGPERVGLGQSLRRYKTALVGLVFLSALLLTALGAPLIAPHDPHKVSVADRLRPAAGMRGDPDRARSALPGSAATRSLGDSGDRVGGRASYSKCHKLGLSSRRIVFQKSDQRRSRNR